MKFVLAALLFAVISPIIAACAHSQDFRYLDSQMAESLEIPPDLTVKNFDAGSMLPNNFSSDVKDPKSQEGVPVLLKVDSLQLEGDKDFYWLSVDEPVDNLYALVKDFWSSEGFKIKIDEPAIGLLETDWVYKKVGNGKSDASFLERIFASDELSATQDQFRTRIERDADTGNSLIFIAHRGTAYEHIMRTKQNEGEKLNTWELTPYNRELEIEMLSRLMIYLGLQSAALDQQREQIKLFSPLSSIQANYASNETYLLINDVYSKAWYRTLYQLDRMNMEIVSANMNTGLRTKGYIKVKINAEEEVTVGGFWFGGSETKMVKKQVMLVFTEESFEVTRISIIQPDGEIDSSKDSVELLTLLHQFLK